MEGMYIYGKYDYCKYGTVNQFASTRVLGDVRYISLLDFLTIN